jgi:uncharacterized membrane protein
MGRWQLRGHSRGYGEKGVAAIEAALTLPLYLALMFGVIDMGTVMFKQVQMDRATLMAARCAAVRQSSCLTTADIQTYAASQTGPFKIAASVFEPTTDTCGFKVTAQLTHKLLFAHGALGSITLSSSSCMIRTDIAPSG